MITMLFWWQHIGTRAQTPELLQKLYNHLPLHHLRITQNICSDVHTLYTPPFKTNFIFFVTIKPRYSSFFSTGRKDFKNVIFEKIGWALFEVAEVAHMKLSQIKKLKALCSKNFSKLAQKRIFCICDLKAAHLTSLTS